MLPPSIKWSKKWSKKLSNPYFALCPPRAPSGAPTSLFFFSSLLTRATNFVQKEGLLVVLFSIAKEDQEDNCSCSLNEISQPMTLNCFDVFKAIERTKDNPKTFSDSLREIAQKTFIC